MSNNVIPIVFSLENTDGTPIDLSTEPAFYFSAVNTWDDTVISDILMPTVSGGYVSVLDLDVSSLSDGIYVGTIQSASAGYYQATTQFSVIGGMSSPENIAGHLGPCVVTVGVMTSSGDLYPGIPINGAALAIYDVYDNVQTGTYPASSSSGAIFYLPSGSYILGAYKPGYYFDGMAFTVSGDTDLVLYGTGYYNPIPGSSELCEIRGNMIDLGGSPASGQVVSFHPSRIPSLSSGKFVVMDPVRVTTDASGNFTADVIAGAEVIVHSEDAIKSYKFTVPYTEFAYLADIVPN